jgi:hypothetical protein
MLNLFLFSQFSDAIRIQHNCLYLCVTLAVSQRLTLEETHEIADTLVTLYIEKRNRFLYATTALNPFSLVDASPTFHVMVTFCLEEQTLKIQWAQEGVTSTYVIAGKQERKDLAWKRLTGGT